MTELGVNAVGEIDRRRAGRKIEDVSTRREHEYLTGEHVGLQRVDKFRGVRVELVLPRDKLLNPISERLWQRSGFSLLFVVPVRRDAELCYFVHLVRTDLDLRC